MRSGLYGNPSAKPLPGDPSRNQWLHMSTAKNGHCSWTNEGEQSDARHAVGGTSPDAACDGVFKRHSGDPVASFGPLPLAKAILNVSRDWRDSRVRLQLHQGNPLIVSPRVLESTLFRRD